MLRHGLPERRESERRDQHIGKIHGDNTRYCHDYGDFR
jgi:hypothetical protein